MTEPTGVTVERLIALNQTDDRQLTDTGAGTTFVDLHRRLVRYAEDVDRWLLWDEKTWTQDGEKSLRAFALTMGVVRDLREQTFRDVEDGDARNARLRAITQLEGVRKRRAMLEVASADPRIRVEMEDFDRDPWTFVCDDVTVDLRTGQARRHDPAEMNSRRATVAYDPAATSPLLDEFMRMFIPDPVEQRFVFALLGYCLRGGNARRLLPIFYGGTTSGKSQLFAALHKVLGSYVCTIGSSVFRGNLDDKPRPDLVQAMFTRVAYAMETSKSWALHADQVKRLTGGDTIPYRNLWSGVVNKTPRFTPILVTNELPRITGADAPLKRRIIAVHMDKTIPPHLERPEKRDAFLNDPACLRALLARLVAGARDEQALRDVPERFSLATMQARGDLDHTDEFLLWAYEEGIIVDVGPETPTSSCVSATELFGCYRFWIKKYADPTDKRDELGRTGFGKAIREKGWEVAHSGKNRWVGKALGPTLPYELSVGIRS